MIENIVAGPVEFKVVLCHIVFSKQGTTNQLKKKTLLSRPHPEGSNQH